MSKEKPEPKTPRQVRDEAIVASDKAIRTTLFTLANEKELSPSETFYIISNILADLTEAERIAQYKLHGIEPE